MDCYMLLLYFKANLNQSQPAHILDDDVQITERAVITMAS